MNEYYIEAKSLSAIDELNAFILSLGVESTHIDGYYIIVHLTPEQYEEVLECPDVGVTGLTRDIDPSE